MLIPERNRRHLMLDGSVLDAVEQGLFHIYTASHAGDGLALLTGQASGLPCDAAKNPYPADSVLGQAETTLLAYRRACRLAAQGRAPKRTRA